ncbi:MAG: transcription antitermination factor NusB [Oscillatoria sp. PMC 1051.18]|nr:transcription antitermination factor NusB [Oscillatoria sp. PMC 1050.18]MEC5028755.1 transcription antitermination factor NusB [Oscillatoria sp. PMC 1051.18]
MKSQKRPRRIARELALLSLSQISGKPEKLAERQLNDLVVAALRTLRGEMQEALETAVAEVIRGSDRLKNSETNAATLSSARAMVTEAIELTQSAINRLGTAIDLPVFIQLAEERTQVRSYAVEIISTVYRRREEIDVILSEAIVNWQLNRLPKIDRDILRIAVAEILFLNTEEQVAINEAVELAKSYSDDEGRRLINGVLRRVSNKIGTKAGV